MDSYCFYIKLIQAEFDLSFAAEFREHVPWLDPLSDTKIIRLWQVAYLKWKVQIEDQIKYLFPAYIAPDFVDMVAKETMKQQKQINDLLYNTPPNPRRSNCTDGEAEFWRAVNNGDLDAIGF